MLIDIHCHCHKPRHEKIKHLNGCWPTPEQLITMMDKAGIDMAVILGCVNPETRWTLVIPEEIMEISVKYPDRLIPFCNFDPRYLTNTTDTDFLPLLGAYKDMGFKGVGEYFPNIPFDDPLNMNFFKQVEEVGLPLTFHIATSIGGQYGCYDEAGLPRLEKVLQQCPKLILLGHSQPFWAEIGKDVPADDRGGYPTGKVNPGRIVELMREYPNLCGDLSSYSGFNAISRDMEFGCKFMEEFQDRLYFGSDFSRPGLELPFQIVDFFKELKTKALISTEEYEKITFKNAVKLLKLEIKN